jgi:hypothetical protein
LHCEIFYEAKSQLQVHGYIDADWLVMFQIKDQPMVSCFLLEMVVLVGVMEKKPTITLLSTEAKYRGVAIATCEVVWLQKLLSDWDSQWMFMLSFIVITSVAYYLLIIRSIMLGQSTLRCTTTLLKKKF